MNVKHYRPHILVVIALAVVLMSGWHDAFRNALADLRFGPCSARPAATSSSSPSTRRRSRRSASGRGRAGSMPTCSASWRRPVSATSPSTSISARRRIRHPIANSSRRCGARRLGDPAVVPAARRGSGQSGRAPYQSSAEAVRRSVLGGAGQHRDRARRPGAPLSVRRQARRRVSAVDGRDAGRAVHQQGRAVPDRFRHSRRLGAVGLLCRRVARRRGDPRKARRTRRSSSAAPRSSSAIASAFRTAASCPDPCCRRSPPKSILQNRTLRWTSDLVTLADIAAISLIMMFAWRRFKPGARVVMLLGTASLPRPRRCCCRPSGRSFSIPRCWTRRSSSISPRSRSTRSIFAGCSAASPNAASSASRCRSATVWSAPTRTIGSRSGIPAPRRSSAIPPPR